MRHYFNADPLGLFEIDQAIIRSRRTLQRHIEDAAGAIEAVSDAAILPAGGLGAAPRRTRSTTRKPASGGDDDGADRPAPAGLEALVATLIEKIAELSKPAIPVEFAMWDVATIASYLRRSEGVVRERVVCTPSFPAAIRLPNAAGQKMQPLWRAQEVIDWTMSHKDRKPH